MRIKALSDSGDLNHLRAQLIEFDESVRGVSQMFFINDKYPDSRPSVFDVLKAILDISHFSNEKDQQYMYRLECEEPQRQASVRQRPGLANSLFPRLGL